MPTGALAPRFVREAGVSIVAVVGSCNMDLVSRAHRIPRAGEHLLATGFGTFLGGKGANQAVAARRAGSSVTMVARVGRDAFGDLIVAALGEEGIDTSSVSRDDGEPTGNASIWLDDAGENRILVFPGANGQLVPTVVADAPLPTGPRAVLLMQLEVPMATVVATAARARDLGLMVVVNAAPAAPLPPELWALVHVLVVNETEASALVGIDDPEAAARALVERGCGAAVVTLGAAGCVVAASSNALPVRIRALAPSQVVDTTGAGDAFCGVMASRLGDGASLAEAAWAGNAAGSLAVEVLGAIPSMPTARAINDRMAQRS